MNVTKDDTTHARALFSVVSIDEDCSSEKVELKYILVRTYRIPVTLSLSLSFTMPGNPHERLTWSLYADL